MSTSSNANTDPPNQNSHSNLPDPALKWGNSSSTTTAKRADNDSNTDTDKPDFSTYYSEEEQAKLRAKGVNPALKAEMEWSRKRSKEGGFWGKVGAMGWAGGNIK